MCEKVRRQPEARKITGMEEQTKNTVPCECKRKERRSRDSKKSGKRDVDARDPSGRVRASISVSSTVSFHSAPHF